MLSLGLKNAILVLLIILILHVLIKNAIIDHKPVKEKFITGSPVGDENATKIMAPTPTCPKPEVKVKEETDEKDDENELLKYVYGDDKDAGDLSQYFKGMDITKDVKKEINAKMSCSSIKNKSEGLPLSTTCDPQLQTLNTDEVLLLKQKKPDSQTISNMMLGEYEDENAMNGGALYGNLSAYDDMAFSFEDYKCEENS